MIWLEIPLSSDAPHFSQENQLFGRSYNFEFEWIEREGFWVWHIYDASEQPIALGVRLIAEWPLLVHHTKEQSIAFYLLPKTPHAQLDLTTLYADFTLVAHAVI